MENEFRTFEDLELYKLAREYRKKMYKLARELPEHEKFVLAPQIRRAAVSLTNNIAEGHGRYFYQENIQFCRIARGTLEELLDDLNVCLDEGYFNEEYLLALKEEGFSLLRKINGYIKYLEHRKKEE